MQSCQFMASNRLFVQGEGAAPRSVTNLKTVAYAVFLSAVAKMAAASRFPEKETRCEMVVIYDEKTDPSIFAADINRIEASGGWVGSSHNSDYFKFFCATFPDDVLSYFLSHSKVLSVTYNQQASITALESLDPLPEPDSSAILPAVSTLSYVSAIALIIAIACFSRAIFQKCHKSRISFAPRNGSEV